MIRTPFRLAIGTIALFVALLGISGCNFGGESQVDSENVSQSYGDADDVLDNADDLREDFKSGDVEMDESAKGADITLLG